MVWELFALGLGMRKLVFMLLVFPIHNFLSMCVVPGRVPCPDNNVRSGCALCIYDVSSVPGISELAKLPTGIAVLDHPACVAALSRIITSSRARSR